MGSFPLPAIRRVVATITLLIAALPTSAFQNATGDLVELDVAVVDKSGATIGDLKQSDFQIKEDGKAVEIKTFTPVAADGLSPDTTRQLVLLLDDTIPVAGTTIIQQMANAVISRSRPDDEVTVVRLHNDRDEPFGDLDTALGRISGYRAGAVPFQRRATAERMLKVLTAVARQLETVEHRRKLVVCVGWPNVCNILEPQPQGYNPLWPAWVAALSAVSRANAAVYAVMPVAPGAMIGVAYGLVEITGGIAFFNTSKFDRFVDSVWREASQYYLLGYWPRQSKRELHDIQVKVARKGLQVRARTRR
jgi:VWFA-related protein